MIFDVLDIFDKEMTSCALTESFFCLFYLLTFKKITIMDIKQYNKTSEELLTDFINSQKVEDDVLTNKKITEELYNYNYKGFDYKFPVQQQHNESHLLNSFYFVYGKQQVGTQEDNFLFNTKLKDDDDICILTNVNERKKNISDIIEVLLYKKGMAEPLVRQKSELNGDCQADIICNPEWSNLKPGEYFILLTNVHDPSEEKEELRNYVWYPFFMLANGSAVRHPDIKSTKITIDGIKSGFAGNSTKNCFEKNNCRQTDDLLLDIRIDNVLKSLQRVSATCYNAHLLLMGKSYVQDGNNSHNNKLLRFNVSSTHIWSDGEYFIILKNNQIPFAKINFRLNGNHMLVDKPENITDDKRFAILANFLETNKSWKDKFQALPGMRDIRLKIWEQAELYALNKLRRENNLCTMGLASHFLLIGPENGHKVSIAGAIADIFDILKRFVHKSAKDIVEEQRRKERSTNDYYMDNIISSGSAYYIDNLSAFFSAEGINILGKIESVLQNISTECTLALGGTESDIRQLFEMAPNLKSYFSAPNHFYVQSFSIDDVLSDIKARLAQMSFTIEPEACRRLYEYLKSEEEHGNLKLWNQSTTEQFVREQILPIVQQRIFKSKVYAHDVDLKILTSIFSCDVDMLVPFKERNDSYTECMSLFDSLIGLNSIKENVKDMFSMLYFNDKRKNMGLPAQQAMSHHMIFTGNPGTGKTTVAKLIGKIYHSLGIISKGGVIVTERNKIVGRYIGETEKNMLELLSKARGNVLFIDEAYSLCDSKDDRRDFGQRAIEALLTVLSQDNPDMIVIFAGYQKEMDYMMESNIGLQGRFLHKFHFEDYSAEELLQIGNMIAEKGKYIFTPEARELWVNYVTDSYRKKDRFFSNARWINQAVNHGLLTIMAQRLMQHPEISDKKIFQTIEKEDVLTLISKTNKQNEAKYIRPVVGFRA